MSSDEPAAVSEARLLAAVLAHIDRRVREFDRRLALLEAGPVGEDGSAAARGLYVEIRRVAAATSLLQLHLQVRREQLSELRATASDPVSTTMEAS
jgi:hypothetical protein